MKRYIRCSSNDLEFFQTYPYCCNYTASNETWGNDAKKYLSKVGGEYRYTKLPDPDHEGRFFRPWHYYFFKSIDAYYEFIEQLREADLLGLIQLRGLREVATGNTVDSRWFPDDL
ncbi:MAG: hypothetical protein IJE78_05120 [Bacteroidaceae bacterium]|nr:hypothetical protein [Bacteroidaceae bacterium]